MRGKPYSWLETGADFSYSHISDENRQQAIVGAATSVIPDFATKLTKLNLFAKYAMKKDTALRLNYIFDRFETNDWTWSNWTYSDGTRVLQSPIQKVHFIGVAISHRWR